MVGHGELLERFQRGRACWLRRGAVELERQGAVLERGQPGEQVEVLEDVADRAAAQLGAIRARDDFEVDALDEHLAAGGVLEAAGDRQERALARAARSHDSDQLAALDREVDRAKRVHLARTGAVDLRYLAQFERACHCETSIVRVGSSGTSAGAGVGSVFKRTSAASSQRTIASSRNSSASATSASGTSSSAASALIRV